MNLSKEELRKNYERLDEGRLMRLASEEATQLTPEALEILKQVIKERGMSEDIMQGIDKQFVEIDENTLSAYSEFLRRQPCPICSSSSEKLNATMIGSVVSFIVMTNYEKEVRIGCPDCLDKENSNAMIKSVALGLWAFPWGIVRTVQSLIFNNNMKEGNHMPEANDIFRLFVRERIGRIEASKNNPEELQAIVKYLRTSQAD